MLGHITGRLAQSLFVLAAVSVIAFSLLSFAGDPVAMILGPDSAPQDRAELRARLRLDDPFALRYLRYVGQLFQGELGNSYATGQPVARVLVERIPATLELALVAVLLSLALGVPLGIATAIRRDSALARAVMTLSLLGLSLPTFVVAVLLVALFSVTLGWLPSFGRGATVAIGFWTTGLLTASGRSALILPAVSLAIAQATLVARLVHADMIEILHTDFIRFARGRSTSGTRCATRSCR